MLVLGGSLLCVGVGDVALTLALGRGSLGNWSLLPALVCGGTGFGLIIWMWLLLWALAHTAEHTYMLLNYLRAVQQLADQGLPPSAAQGLPGFFGHDGWLATNAPATGPIAFVCTIVPGLTNAPRLDVHFWWNIGEVVLLLPAAHLSMRRYSGATVSRGIPRKGSLS